MTQPPVETSDADVVRILRTLADAGVETWVAGGWGVDALVRRQTRSHRDLDLLIPLPQTLRAFEAMTGAGFSLHTDVFPTRFEMVHARGAAVDLHPIRGDAEGGAGLELPDGTWWHFSDESLSGHGLIGGQSVRCISVTQQIRNHTGYEPSDTDRRDVELLVEAFGLRAPARHR